MANQLRIYKTTKRGIKFNFNVFIYEKNKKSGDKFYWVCELRRNNDYKCNVRLTTKQNEDESHELISKHVKKHNHEPNPLREKVCKTRYILLVGRYV